MFSTKSYHFSPKLSRTFMEIGNQMQSHEIETNSELGSIIDFNYYQKYLQQYTVNPITTVIGPFDISSENYIFSHYANNFCDAGQVPILRYFQACL